MNATERIAARGAAQKRIPLTGKVCEKCGADGTTERGGLERHHPDYAHPLDVVILCGMCHREAHGVKPLEPRICEICGAVFYHRKLSVKSCRSPECKAEARSRSRRKVWARKREEKKQAQRRTAA